MKEFELRELKSRKLKTVTPILWVGAAVALTAQGFPAWEEPKQFKQSQKRIVQTVPELNNYPETPAGYYSGFFPGSQIAEATKKQSKYSVQQLPELNSYPPTPAPVSYAAIVESGYNFNDGLKRKPLSVELNEYPTTPAGYYSGFYPGSSLATGFKTRFDRSLQTVELNEYPSAPPSIADITAVTFDQPFYRGRVYYDARQSSFSFGYIAEPTALDGGIRYVPDNFPNRYAADQANNDYVIDDGSNRFTV